MAWKDFANAAVQVENPIKDLTVVKLAAGAATPPHTHAEGYVVVPFWPGSAERVIQKDGVVIRREPVTLLPLVPYYVDATASGHTTAFRNTGKGLSIFQKYVPKPEVTGPQPELHLEKLTITSQAQSRNVFVVEVAVTLQEKAVGLMFRPNLAPDRGMLFVWPDSMPVAMYMRNVYVPLDILFIDENFTISHIHANAVPGDPTPIPSKGNVILTLEIPGGSAARLGIVKGDKVD